MRALENEKMGKKKKTVIILGIILILIISLFGKYQYTKYQLNENLKLAEMRSVFLIVNPENKDFRKSNYTDVELKAFIKNPPKIQMDTGAGLGIKVLAYNYYNAGDINPYAIQELMESGQFHEAYEYTEDFVHWSNNYPNEIIDYKNAMQYAANKLETPLKSAEDTTYQEYLNIINDPDGQKYMEEYFASIGE